MNGTQRLSVLYSLLNPFKPFYFSYERDISARCAQTTKDCIAPTQIDFKPDGVLSDCFKLDNGVYGQVLVMRKFGSELSDRALADLVGPAHPHVRHVVRAAHGQVQGHQLRAHAVRMD